MDYYEGREAAREIDRYLTGSTGCPDGCRRRGRARARGGRPVAVSSRQSSFSKQESTSIDTCGTPMISITVPRVR